MGVMACGRRSCTNVLCDRYSNEYGYICGECFREMVDTNVLDIDTFMQTPRNNKTQLTCDKHIYEEIFRK